MRNRVCGRSLAPLLIGLAISCGDDEPGPVDAGMPDVATASIYDRLGGAVGVSNLVDDFLRRVIADPAINGYFLNRSLDSGRLKTCLVKQLSAATGSGDTYPGPGDPADSDGCRNMADAHAGLGVSANDFADLVSHLTEALEARGTNSDDIAQIAGVLSPFESDIVEDPDNDKTIYQRAGRRPELQTAVNRFLGFVLADPAINVYFTNRGFNQDRLLICLGRQLCAVSGGPCKYGEGIDQALDRDGDGTVSESESCRDMGAAHRGLGISQRDFDGLVGHLVGSLASSNLSQEDVSLISGALYEPEVVSAIVEDPDNDQTAYQRMGRMPAMRMLAAELTSRVTANPAINAYFLNNSLNGARLSTCLARQFCEQADGPCIYGRGIESTLDLDGDRRVSPEESCRDMQLAHAGLGISAIEFDWFTMDLLASLDALMLPQEDSIRLVDRLTQTGTLAQIIEDLNGVESVYQRVGRKPRLTTIVNDFLARVSSNAEINGFFSGVDTARLSTCLVRQLCAIDGPCKYGEGLDPELDRDGDGTVDPSSEVCREMGAAHSGAVDGAGASIDIADFNALVSDLVDALDGAGVTQEDRDAIVGALAPLCPQIVATNANQCP